MRILHWQMAAVADELYAYNAGQSQHYLIFGK